MTHKNCKNVESFFKQISELSTTASAATWSLFPVLTFEPGTRGTCLCYQPIPCGWGIIFTWVWRRTTWWTGTKWNFFRCSSGEKQNSYLLDISSLGEVINEFLSCFLRSTSNNKFWLMYFLWIRYYIITQN